MTLRCACYTRFSTDKQTPISTEDQIRKCREFAEAKGWTLREDHLYTDIALSDIFPDDQALENRSETVYFGGPVEPRAPGVVFRSSKPVKHAALLFGDIYVSFDPDFIRELLKEPKKTPDLRLFVGRSQWAQAQLQNEMAMGAWLSVRAETNLIFSPSPQYLWRKLFDHAEPAPVARVA